MGSKRKRYLELRRFTGAHRWGLGGVRGIPRMREPSADQGWAGEAGPAQRTVTTVLSKPGKDIV